MIFAQIINDTEVAVDIASTDLSLLDLLFKGGWVMIPLALLFVSSLYIFFERILVLKKATSLPQNFNEQVRAMVLSGNINGAKAYCQKSSSPMAKMISKGISRIGKPLKNIETSIENVANIELYRLEKNLSLLATISGAAPMIGFLGTVTGMIAAFMSIAKEEGSVSPKLLSSGIYEAMITTAVGLFVGIIAYLAYNYLVARVQKLVHQMETTSVDFVELLQDPS